MHIAQIATLSAPVREETTGSVESLVWLLTRELRALGHEVTVFGSADSQPPAELVSSLPGPYATNGSPDDWQLCEWINLCKAVEQSARFDVLHAHAYLWGMPLEQLSRAPMVHTLHIVPDEDTARLWSIHPESKVTAISRNQWEGFPNLKPAAVIPHGIDATHFTLQPKPEDYILYLGRFVAGKGPLHAISIARKLGVRLIMAGPSNAYFRERVQPQVDGRTVEYVGFVKGPERDKLLGGAKALIYPIQYPEAFGLVLIEAMLCGTPVAAIRLGAVPEIVDEGITGFMASSMDELPEALVKCFSLDRAEIRRRTEECFSARRMAEGYLQVYNSVAS
jgi:glycosyltransferase involved in cell wall biosynthesis